MAVRSRPQHHEIVPPTPPVFDPFRNYFQRAQISRLLFYSLLEAGYFALRHFVLLGQFLDTALEFSLLHNRLLQFGNFTLRGVLFRIEAAQPLLECCELTLRGVFFYDEGLDALLEFSLGFNYQSQFGGFALRDIFLCSKSAKVLLETYKLTLRGIFLFSKDLDALLERFKCTLGSVALFRTNVKTLLE